VNDRRSRPRVLIPVFILVSLIVVGLLLREHRLPADHSAEFETATAARRPLTTVVLAPGPVKAIVSAEVQSRISDLGVVTHLLANIGSSMAKGRLIAQPAGREARCQVDQARPDLAVQRGRLADLKAGFDAQLLWPRTILRPYTRPERRSRCGS